MDQDTAHCENRRRDQRAARNARLDAELASYRVKRWLSVPQWARARGISVRFAYEQARKGRLKIKKAGRRSFITPEADTAWSNSLPVLNSSVLQALIELLNQRPRSLKSTEPARSLRAGAG